MGGRKGKVQLKFSFYSNYCFAVGILPDCEAVSQGGGTGGGILNIGGADTAVQLIGISAAPTAYSGVKFGSSC